VNFEVAQSNFRSLAPCEALQGRHAASIQALSVVASQLCMLIDLLFDLRGQTGVACFSSCPSTG